MASPKPSALSKPWLCRRLSHFQSQKVFRQNHSAQELPTSLLLVFLCQVNVSMFPHIAHSKTGYGHVRARQRTPYHPLVTLINHVFDELSLALLNVKRGRRRDCVFTVALLIISWLNSTFFPLAERTSTPLKHSCCESVSVFVSPILYLKCSDKALRIWLSSLTPDRLWSCRQLHGPQHQNKAQPQHIATTAHLNEHSHWWRSHQHTQFLCASSLCLLWQFFAITLRFMTKIIVQGMQLLPLSPFIPPWWGI